MTENVTVGSWYIPTHQITSVQARTVHVGILHEKANHDKNASSREMQNSSIAHVGIGSTSEDDNTTSTTPIIVVLSSIFGVFDLSHGRKNRGCFIMTLRFSPLLIDAMKSNENKETSSDFHCCVMNNSNIK
jgi:hypothetical protein